jgi:chromosome segregation ATPase
MIDEQLIESAKKIRKNFLNLSDRLELYREDVKALTDFLVAKVEEIKSYNDETIRKMRTKDELAKATNHLLKEIGTIEDEEKKLQKKVEKINVEMEKLKNEEEILYKTIKTRYPHLEDEKIVKEIQSHLER